jgi:hypothetical protein
VNRYQFSPRDVSYYVITFILGYFSRKVGKKKNQGQCQRGILSHVQKNKKKNHKWPQKNVSVKNCWFSVHKICQTLPAKFGQILLRTDTRLVFCYRKLMRTDIFFIRTTKPLCYFVNPEITIFVHTIGEDFSYSNSRNCIGGVMVSVLAPSAVDRGFDPRLGQTKDYEIGICCFSSKHTTLRRRSKDWLARNQDNV